MTGKKVSGGEASMTETNAEPTAASMTLVFRVGRVVLGFFMLVGIGVSFLGAKMISEAASSKEWPSVRGTIKSSYLERRKGGTRAHFRPKIVYEYRVKGRKYVGQRIRFGQDIEVFIAADRKITERYPKGASVRISYNPVQPSQAVLEPGVNIAACVPLGVGLAILFMSMIFLRGLKRLESTVLQGPRPMPSEPGHDRPERVRVEISSDQIRRLIVWGLAVLLIALLIWHYYGDDIKRRIEKAKKEMRVQISPSAPDRSVQTTLHPTTEGDTADRPDPV
jgi:hypothetical protein